MKKLSIGQLADFLGVPPSTMRFYESKGIVAPEKDSRNSYRAYTAPESCRILLSRLYQSFGFSLAETAELLAKRDHDGLMDSLGRRLGRVDDEIARLAALRGELAEYRRDCSSFAAGQPAADARDRDAAFEPAWLPGMDYIFTIISSSPDCEKERAALAREWMASSPLPSFFFLVPEGAFLGKESFSSRWGFGLESKAEDGRRGGLVESYPASPALATTLLRKKADRLGREELEGAIRAFAATGRKMAGPACGRFLEILYAGEEELYLYRLYIPVKE